MMKKLLLLIALSPSVALAGGPKYTYPTPPGLDDEVRNLYHDIANPVVNVETVSTATITNLVGVTDGSNAAPGNIGEVKSCTTLRSNPAAMLTGTGNTICSVVLTPGDWAVRGMIGYHTGGAATTISDLEESISLNGNVLSGNDTEAVPDAAGQIRASAQYAGTNLSPGAANDTPMPMLISRVNITSNTSYFLVGQASFGTSTLAAYGSLVARRVR